jgi:hypothetical protein
LPIRRRPRDNHALARPGRAHLLPDLSEHPVKQSQLAPPPHETRHGRSKTIFTDTFS